jgi:hypothetical protein
VNPEGRSEATERALMSLGRPGRPLAGSPDIQSSPFDWARFLLGLGFSRALFFTRDVRVVNETGKRVLLTVIVMMKMLMWTEGVFSKSIGLPVPWAY